MKEITDLINTVGFPIVVSIAMFYQNNVLSQSFQKITQELATKIESNTLVITRLLDQLDKAGITPQQGSENK